jgi:hypothetical protein
MALQKKQALQRIRYSADQLLAAKDLNDDEYYEATLRRMHVRGLHDTWGVALGFDLSIKDNVQVGPGLAYDAQGRELLLSDTLAVPNPEPPAGMSVPMAYDLALTQRDPAEILARRKQRSECADRITAEGITLHWVLAGESNVTANGLLAKGLRLGIEVPLGRFTFDPVTQKLSGPQPGFRKNARPLLRPHIATGKVSFDSFGLTADKMSATIPVVTGDAGFISTPQYFVSFPNNALVNSTHSHGFIGPLLSVSDPHHQQFQLGMTFASANLTDAERRANMTSLLNELRGSLVHWVGVEPVTGCQPNPDFAIIYWITGILFTPVVIALPS